MSVTQTIKTEAHRLGFLLAGVTTSDPPPHWPAYQRWLTLGRHGSMGYLEDARRADPRQVLPECKSILVLGMRYPNPKDWKHRGIPRPIGRIASYAWGQDYHLLIPGRLITLEAFIETMSGGKVVQRGYTDTGPILERDLAQRAGLGWIGKNTCLIHPKMGSYFLLAEILLGIQLEPDAPFAPDRCGNCTRCISACPTNCILPDRTIDSRLCISYQTIENKNEIPTELRPRMGNWVFGCDICQQVCPWNRFATSDHDPAFNPVLGIPEPELISEMSISRGEFNRKFKNSPIKRSKWQGYQRNITIALGNSGDPAALEALEGVLKTRTTLIEEHAAWAINRIKQERS